MAIPHRIIPALAPQDILRFWSKVRIRGFSECWPWQAGKADGYGAFGIGRSQNFLAHRVAWTLANGPIPAGLCVCHHCDNPPCQNPRHFFLGTQGDNARDRARKGRQIPPRGERNGQAKLNNKKVCAIRAEYVSGHISQKTLARQFGVTQSNISLIVHHKRWS